MQCADPPAEGAEKPEVELSNLVKCSRLSHSQGSLRSVSSSAGSVRGDEGGLYSEFYGDYCPLFDANDDPDNVSLRGELAIQSLGCLFSLITVNSF